MTKLDAVNTMLGVIDESPVSALNVAGIAALTKAVRILDATSRAVQSRGWAFNSESEYPLAVNTAQQVPLPANTLSVDPDGESAGIDGVQRGSRLYDRGKHTFDFTVPIVYVSIIVEHPFEDLPETAKEYITMLAARRFKAEHLDQPEGAASAAEIEALRNLEEAEADAGDFNVLYDNASTARVLWR